MTVLENWILFNSLIISLDFGPGIGVLTLGPEGSPSMRFDRHFTFCGSCCLKRLDLVVNVFNLLSAIMTVTEVVWIVCEDRSHCCCNQNKTINTDKMVV